jgi:hypothetical protein
MSSPKKSGSPIQDGGNGADDKPRLTEEEKKQNHIASGTLHPRSLDIPQQTAQPSP